MKEDNADIYTENFLHLNFGIPVAIGLIMLIVNAEIFAFKFLEPIVRFVVMYSYSTIFVLFALVLVTKRSKKKKKLLLITYYDFFVHNSVLVLIFLIFNLNFYSENIYETNTPFNEYYKTKKSKLVIPKPYDKFYFISDKEYEKYFKKGYNFQVVVGKSYLGYKFIKKREFVKQ